MSGQTDNDRSSENLPDQGNRSSRQGGSDDYDRTRNRLAIFLRTLRGNIRIWPIFWRALTYSFLGIALVIAIGIAALQHYLTGDLVRIWIQKLVAQETGGKVEIGAAQVNIFSGVSLSSVRFFPPMPPEGEWPKEASQYRKKAAFECERIDIRYSLQGLFAGQINIKALKIDNPKIFVEKKDGTTNLDGIAVFRKSLTNPEEKEPQNNGGASQVPLESILAKFNPALLYMPLKVLVRNIGVQGLSIQFEERIAQDIVDVTRLTGPSFEMSGFWHKTQSRLSLVAGSQLQTPLVYSVVRRRGSEDSASETILNEVESLAIAELSLEDLHKIEVNFAGRVNKTIPDHLRGSDFSIGLRTIFDLNYEKMQLDIRRFSADIPESLAFSLDGNIRILEFDSKKISLNIQHQMHLNLESLFQRAGSFIHGLRGKGTLDVEQLSISGIINPSELGSLVSGKGEAPSILGEINLDDLAIEMDEPALRMHGLNGSLKFGGAKALTGVGLGVDDLLQLSIDTISLRKGLQGGETVTIEASDLSVESAARLLLPQLEAQMARLSVAAEQLKVSGQKLKGWDAPLYLEISADGDKEMSRNAATLNMDWKGLFEVSGGIDCHTKCGRFRGYVRHKIDSIERLYRAVAGIAEPRIPPMFLPARVGGAIDLQVDVQGKAPPQSAADVDRFFADGDLDFKSRLVVSRLDLRMPFKNVDVRGFGLRFEAEGNLREQHLVLETKSTRLGADIGHPSKEVKIKSGDSSVLLGKPTSNMNTMTATGLSLALDVANTFVRPPRLVDLIGSSRTEISLRVGLGQLDRGGSQIEPASSSAVSLDLIQDGLTHVELRSLKGNLPQMGLGLSVQGRTVLDESHLPGEFQVESNLSLSRAEALNVLPGISSQGALHTFLKIDSADMKNINFGGRIDFENFGFTVAGRSGTTEPTLMMADLNGQIPISQSVTIPQKLSLGAIANGDENKETAAAAGKKFEADKDGLGASTLNQAGPIDSSGPIKELADMASQYVKRKSQNQRQTASKAPGVDYPSVKGFFPNRKPLSIKRLVAANLEMTDIILDVEWRENMVGMNEFAIGLLGGELQGNVQISLSNDLERILARPKDIGSFIRKINTNIQATRLDTRKILDRLPDSKSDVSRNSSMFSNPFIDATIHYLWNLESRDLGGSIDITTIGKEQVRMLLSYVDPSQQDQTINDIRKALYLGEVRQVSIPIKNGEIGLDVDIRALGVPIPTPKLSRFPINQLIDNALRNGEKTGQSKESAL